MPDLMSMLTAIEVGLLAESRLQLGVAAGGRLGRRQSPSGSIDSGPDRPTVPHWR